MFSHRVIVTLHFVHTSTHFLHIFCWILVRLLSVSCGLCDSAGGRRAGRSRESTGGHLRFVSRRRVSCCVPEVTSGEKRKETSVLSSLDPYLLVNGSMCPPRLFRPSPYNTATVSGPPRDPPQEDLLPVSSRAGAPEDEDRGIDEKRKSRARLAGRASRWGRRGGGGRRVVRGAREPLPRSQGAGGRAVHRPRRVRRRTGRSEGSETLTCSASSPLPARD